MAENIEQYRFTDKNLSERLEIANKVIKLLNDEKLSRNEALHILWLCKTGIDILDVGMACHFPLTKT